MPTASQTGAEAARGLLAWLRLGYFFLDAWNSFILFCTF